MFWGVKITLQNKVQTPIKTEVIWLRGTAQKYQKSVHVYHTLDCLWRKPIFTA